VRRSQADSSATVKRLAKPSGAVRRITCDLAISRQLRADVVDDRSTVFSVENPFIQCTFARGR
jgi:hypothetical protein